MKRFLIGALFIGCCLQGMAQGTTVSPPDDFFAKRHFTRDFADRVTLEKVFSSLSSSVPVRSIILAGDNANLREHTIHFRTSLPIDLQVAVDASFPLLKFKWEGASAEYLEYCLSKIHGAAVNWRPVPSGKNQVLNLRNVEPGDYSLQFRGGEKNVIEKYVLQIR